MSTPTIDVDLHFDLEALLDEHVVCEARQCDTEATWRLRARWAYCECNATMLLCTPHKDKIYMQMSSFPLWQCLVCRISGAAGTLHVSPL